MKIDPANLDFRDAHHLLADSLVPRPIALISTVGADGVFNVAPFASVTLGSVKPTLIGFEVSTRRDGKMKDTIINIEHSREFVVNVPTTEAMFEAMNHTAYDYSPDVDEFNETGLTPVKADIVKAPMVGEAPVNFECRVVQIIEFGQFPRISKFIFGEVLLAHVKDEFYAEDHISAPRLKAIGRLGTEPYPYCRTREVFDKDLEFLL